MSKVRVENRTVRTYEGYQYYAVYDRHGDFLFAFHIDSKDANVYFVASKVTYNKKSKSIEVRAE